MWSPLNHITDASEFGWGYVRHLGEKNNVSDISCVSKRERAPEYGLRDIKIIPRNFRTLKDCKIVAPGCSKESEVRSMIAAISMEISKMRKYEI